jgi:hypothetical protein
MIIDVEVQCLPHYHYENSTLNKINTTIIQVYTKYYYPIVP